MTDDASPENLRKFLESDDPAMVLMGISLAKGAGVGVTIKDLEHFLKSEDVVTIKTGVMLADEAGIGDEAMEMLCEPLSDEEEGSEWWGWAASDTVVTLGTIGDARAVEPLIEVLSYQCDLPRFYQKRALEYHVAEVGGGEQDGEVVFDEVLEAIAEALGEIGDVRAVEPLFGVLSDRNNDSRVREAAEQALGNICNSVKLRFAESTLSPNAAEAFDVLVSVSLLAHRGGFTFGGGDEEIHAAKEALKKLGHEVE